MSSNLHSSRPTLRLFIEEVLVVKLEWNKYCKSNKTTFKGRSGIDLTTGKKNPCSVAFPYKVASFEFSPCVVLAILQLMDEHWHGRLGFLNPTTPVNRFSHAPLIIIFHTTSHNLG
ncbi:hypothetical protein LR48_Vigan02g125600 [Vigna angularis]|uniref:Uncharacterized protein n=1 Tax=Phaseolus angularis TaxID=3914 RepID=A0A0L9TX76_PHAAN|nr:hypothetical protein LR48_Vigan02g125600 [Vigna angularis]